MANIFSSIPTKDGQKIRTRKLVLGLQSPFKTQTTKIGILAYAAKLLDLQKKVQMSTSTSLLSNTTIDPGNTERDNGASSTGSSPSILTLTTTELHNFLRTRRSIRRFKPDPVPASVIEEILTTATYAPSAHNRQPWRFAVLASL